MRNGLAALSLFFLTAAPALAEGGDRLAVVPLDGPGVDAHLLDELDGAVRDEAKALGMNTVPADEIAQGKRACGGDVKCLLGVGGDVKATRVLSGSVGLAGDRVHVTLRLIDVGLAMEVKSLDSEAPVSEAARRLRATTMKLLAPDKYVTSGAILVSTPLAGAEILVDGVKRGTTPLFAPVDGLAPGRREVEVRYPGAASWRGFLDVSFDRPERLDIVEKDGALVQVVHAGSRSNSPAATPPPASDGTPVLLWVGTGAAATGVVALAGAGFAYASAASAFAQVHDQGKVNRDLLIQNSSMSVAYGILLAVGVGALAAGAGAIGVWAVEQP